MDSQKLAVPSAGNAAGALAAYAAAAGIEAHIFMPQDVPIANYLEGIAYGARRHAGRRPHLRLRPHGRRRIKAQKEATRRQKAGSTSPRSRSPSASKARRPWATSSSSSSAGRYPDAVFYPTGGGVGLIGMWKAFEEMEQLGWVNRASGRR